MRQLIIVALSASGTLLNLRTVFHSHLCVSPIAVVVVFGRA